MQIWFTSNLIYKTKERAEKGRRKESWEGSQLHNFWYDLYCKWDLAVVSVHLLIQRTLLLFGQEANPIPVFALRREWVRFLQISSPRIHWDFVPSQIFIKHSVANYMLPFPKQNKKTKSQKTNTENTTHCTQTSLGCQETSPSGIFCNIPDKLEKVHTLLFISKVQVHVK